MWIVGRSGRGCTRERRWRIEPSLQRRRGGSTLLYKNPVPVFPTFFEFLTLEDGTDRLSRNVGKKFPLLAA